MIYNVDSPSIALSEISNSNCNRIVAFLAGEQVQPGSSRFWSLQPLEK
jgi:hypothetical protein